MPMDPVVVAAVVEVGAEAGEVVQPVVEVEERVEERG